MSPGQRLPGAWRVPDDLPQRIVKHAEDFRRADDRRYRRSVAIKASELLIGVRSDWAKQSANRARAAKPARVGQ